MPSGRNICPHRPLPLRYTTVLLVSQRPCIWYTGHGRSEANKRLTNSKSGVTGGNYPADNRPIVGRSLISILKDSRKSRNSFPGIEKKTDLRLSSLVNIPNTHWAFNFDRAELRVTSRRFKFFASPCRICSWNVRKRPSGKCTVTTSSTYHQSTAQLFPGPSDCWPCSWSHYHRIRRHLVSLSQHRPHVGHCRLIHRDHHVLLHTKCRVYSMAHTSRPAMFSAVKITISLSQGQEISMN